MPELLNKEFMESIDNILNIINNIKSFKPVYPKFKFINDPLPWNKIYFGAPGTGKSYTLEQERGKYFADNNFERVTFHPEYSYANFVGTYKPFPKKDNNGKEYISYEFVPGPFLRLLVKAILDFKENSSPDTEYDLEMDKEIPDNNEYPNEYNPEISDKIENNKDIEIKKEKIVKPYLLIIEEINRANTAAVFGDMFQLLDRDDNGNSEYEINISEDVKKYLLSNGIDTDTLKIPGNMFIWATMNSADQGVFPMDTAFKRRWEFEYIGIDDNENVIKNVKIEHNLGNIDWNTIRKAINKYMSERLNINEDKQMGPFFIKKTDKKTFKNKVIMYLFEDAVRHKRDKIFNSNKVNINSYSAICKEFDASGIEIFNTEIQDNYK